MAVVQALVVLVALVVVVVVIQGLVLLVVQALLVKVLAVVLALQILLPMTLEAVVVVLEVRVYQPKVEMVAQDFAQALQDKEFFMQEVEAVREIFV
jgi:hypothetical protein